MELRKLCNKREDRERGKMIKFRGKLLNGLSVELPLIKDQGPKIKTICTFAKKNVVPLLLREDTIEIKIAGHWLSIEDLEAIVDKVVGKE